MKIGWLSDTHFDFVKSFVIEELVAAMNKHDVDLWLHSGDIATYPHRLDYLEAFEKLDKPMYFVLGNHDFYDNVVSINQIKRWFDALRHPKLTYLGADNAVLDFGNIVILGVDGWYDIQSGDYDNSQIALTDFNAIPDMRNLNKSSRARLIENLSKESMYLLDSKFSSITNVPREVIVVVTHVPVFEESVLFEGKPQSNDFKPYFTNTSLMKVINNYRYYAKRIVVLSGHTHNESHYQKFNVEEFVFGAQYEFPRFQIMEF